MLSRRSFLSFAPAAALGPLVLEPRRAAALPAMLATYDTPAEEAARDEDFWSEVQQAFTADRTLINFNNGGVSPSPRVVQQALSSYLEFSNQAPVQNMWRVLEPRKETVRTRLASHFGSDREEIAITRNASEGLQICQFGFDLEPGDEVLTTTQDYGRMITTFKQRERRDGIVLKQIQLPIPVEDPDEVVRRFEAAITPRTRLILMCHIINITGQILPVKPVVQMARQRGIPVVVDGAHAFAHFAFDHSDLDCDYYATSLHKWLFAPFGTGMLYVRRNKVQDLWPLMAAREDQTDDIRKFEEIGTHPCPNFLAIGEALTFHEGIGAERKTARLTYLRDRWANRLLEQDRVRLHTSLAPGQACGIANVQIEGVSTAGLARYLWQEHRIIVVAIQHDEFEGLRVSPSVYSTLEEVDRFSDVMEEVIRNDLPERYRSESEA